MIRINLLPVREARRRADVQQQLAVIGLVLAASLGGAGWMHLTMTSKISDARMRVAQTEAEIKKFDEQLKQVEAYKAKKKEVQDKLDVIQGLERSRSGSDARQIATFSYNWELPFGPGKRYLSGAHGALRQVAAGWAVNGVTSFRTGLPLTVFDSANRTQTGGGTARANRVCDGNLSTSQRIPTHWFDTSCFTADRPGTVGTAGRRIIDGPGINNWDLYLQKRTRLGGERVGLEFRIEAFNAFNHTQFGPGPNQTTNLTGVDLNLESPTFGQFVSAREARVIQLGVRFTF